MRTALSFVALALFAAPAFAGGYVAPAAPAPAPVPLPPETSWTGFYAGAQIELLTGEDSGDVGSNADIDGTLFGVFAGYRYDLGNIVVGGEVDYVHGSGEYVGTFGPALGTTQDLDFNSIFRLGVEVGYDVGDALVYGTIGYAALDLGLAGSDFDDDGIFYGVGVDYRLTDSIVVGGELLHHDFSDFVLPGNDITATTFGLNLAFTF